MPSYIDFESVLLRWQTRHNQAPTYAELAEMAGISERALFRMMSGQMIFSDGYKIIHLCQALECKPVEIIRHQK